MKEKSKEMLSQITFLKVRRKFLWSLNNKKKEMKY